WDFDNNGFVDIYSEMATNLYWNNGDGTFTSGPSTGFTRAGIGDFNNDGYLDAISGNSLWMNDGSQNHYIKFSLEGILSNRSALGARIEIYGDFGMQVREVRSGESFSPGSSLTEHFGIGTSTSIDQVIIKWPSQQITTINNPAIDQTHFILEASCMNPPIAIAAQGSTEICPGQSVILTAPAASSYTWNTGDNSSTLEVTESGSYYVVAFDAAGCAAVSNNVVVTVIEESQPTIQMIGESIACEGEEVILTSSVAATYDWSEGSTGQSIVVTETGDYYVQVSGQCSGVFYTSDMIHVEILAASAPIANDVTINANSTATLVAAGENLQWYDSSDLNNPVGSGNTFTTPVITGNTSYWVQSETIYGGESQAGGLLAYDVNAGGTPSTGGVLFFNTSEPFTLEQVTVFVPSTSTAGPRTIQLFDAGNAVIQELIVDCAFGENVVTLNFEVPAGNALSIGCAENNLFRTNSGLMYPYAIGDIGEIY
ncbi:MAG: ASPIC/UnbV domain-containing protein, partial [Flavobacteriales bacterium]